MSSEQFKTTHILDLPPEIIVNIIDKLPLEEIDTVRLVCSVFNDAGKYVKKTALHKLLGRADCAVRRCQARLQSADEARAHRVLHGECSVRYLRGIIQVVDAATLPLVLEVSSSPMSTEGLLEVERCLQLAYRRRLVGRDRLRLASASLHKYLTATMASVESPGLDSLFRCVSGLLLSLSHTTHSVLPTAYGLYCLIYLDFLSVTFNARESYSPAALVVVTLAKLNLKLVLQDYVSQDHMFSLFREKGRNDVIAVNHIELKVECCSEDCVGVSRLDQVCLLEPKDFQVVIHWTSTLPTPDYAANIEDLSAYTFTYSLQQLFSHSNIGEV